MTEPSSSPPQAPPFTLPPAFLHGASDTLHPDSEEFVRGEAHRTAKELDPIYEPGASTSRSKHPKAPSAFRTPSLRARGASANSSPYHGGVPSIPSEVTTAQDSDGPEAQDVRRYRLRRQIPHWYDPIVRFWTRHVSVTIDEGSHRDHLALERTFLGYLRTSLAFAMTGVVIAQLFRLQHVENPNRTFGFYILGTPLAACFITFGAVVLLVGALRFWRQQAAMIRGKVVKGGWEIALIMVFSIAVSSTLFFYLIFT
ncbi:hypothetical protein K491DRAFT_697514 [Lophiostoma macrostomum CBS 122681]|uniref:DUF202 domain-containing protein n=1 Tax=Lophiostoma macrostomum CBS 122681 TaxID=1314788 RepID=A0A6A6SR45_9PLEO|nr:hypothetical protein K491DRAFT_697514 [Lophiostoma macrostomum CBS 122681]